LFGIVHLLANTYGWNIQYICSLTLRQINGLSKGAMEVDRQNKSDDKRNQYKVKGKVKDGNQISDLMKLGMMPGVKMKSGVRKKFLDAVDKMKGKNNA